MRGAECTPEKWAVTNSALARLLLDHDPPRADAYRYQLRADARGWRPWTLWAAGAALLAAGP